MRRAIVIPENRFSRRARRSVAPPTGAGRFATAGCPRRGPSPRGRDRAPRGAVPPWPAPAPVACPLLVRRVLALTLTLAAVGLSACGARAGSGHPAAQTAQTFCGWDGGGACSSLGDGMAPAVPSVVGHDHEVDIAPFFTSDAVTAPGVRLRHGGLYGAAFPERPFPSSGTLTLTVAGDQRVSFLIPRHAPGTPSALSLGHQVTVPVPTGVYGALWLLEAGVGGNIGPLHLTLHYPGGRAATVPVTFGDWCNGGFPPLDAPPEYVGISLPVVLSTPAAMAASATAAGPPPAAAAGASLRLYHARCGLWAEEVPLPAATVPLEALTLPAARGETDPMAFIMAMTLQTGGAPPLPSGT